MTGSAIRRRFLEYFQAEQHKIVPSSSLMPAQDPTLLFTNAGMNQFKDVFLGLEQRDYRRATTAQKCVRAGGKHNDLENVGFTNRHHTFFEMLGNFSFGDYFKREAIGFAWELLTSAGGFGLDQKKLYATVFTDDGQAEEMWRRDIGLPVDRVFRLGEKDNFWAMGETGPCGPCSEVHIDLGPAASEAGHADCRFPCDCGRYLELWNLVFMQFDRDGSGRMNPLPQPSIDTGAGLERLAAVLQGKLSNFSTDLFQPLIRRASERAGVEYGAAERSDVSLRIIADHARAATFLVQDGVVPAPEGRGYVLRKIVRRALRHGRILGIEGAFLHELAGTVADGMEAAYPDLAGGRARVATILKNEEERFAVTLALALKELERTPLETAGGGRQELGQAAGATLTMREHQKGTAGARLGGAEIFKLYDTYGLPVDLLREIAGERGFSLDEAGFEAEMERQRHRARKSWKAADAASAAGVYLELASGGGNRFEGYETVFSSGCTIQALLVGGNRVEALAVGAEGEAVLDHTPFYAASGGQIGDRGWWSTADGVAAEVLDTVAPVGGLNLHRIRAHQPLRTGMQVDAAVDEHRRDATRRNHTATHLLHAALREVLGAHVKQAGSVVEPARLRFDFTHYAPLSAAQLEEIERLVNREVLKNEPVNTEIMPLDRALETGAMALFGEKYTEHVRVVSIPGFSLELCGGTHCRRTGDIGLFKLAYETSVAAGVRRIEALTGEGAYAQFREAEERLQRLSRLVRAQEPELVAAVEKLLAHQQELQQELARLKMESAQAQTRAGGERKREVRGVSVLAARADNLDRAQLRGLLDELRVQSGASVIALGGAAEGKTAVLVAVSPELSGRLPAGRLLKELPGVSGGGKPTLAEGGGKDADQLDAALEAVYGAVDKILA